MKPKSVPLSERKRSLPKPVKHSIQTPVRRRDFDPDTGQVYQETEVVFQKVYSSDWIGEYKTPSIRRKPRTSASGTKSLLDLSRSKFVNELRNSTPEHFETIPWSLASTIWAEVVSTHSETFHAWRTLASVYNDETEFGKPENRYYLEIKQPPLPVQEYFRGISQLDNKWGSTLRISPKQLTIPELVAISSITNLTVLDLSDGQTLLDTMPSRFDERIMRTWAELASGGRAFQHLEGLMLGWQDSVSAWIFNYLDRFPRLRYIVVTDCKYMHQKNRIDWEDDATAHGWTAYHAKRSAKLLRPLLDGKEFRVATISNLYYYARSELSDQPLSEPIDELPRIPIVECWLGTPRPWTHILDEFPGTRTILFHRWGTHSRKEEQGSLDITNKTDSMKRSREVGGGAQRLHSPPRKRQGSRERRLKAPKNTAASLLADMGL